MKRTIQELREERGESRQELADALGVTLDQVTDWELTGTEPTLSQHRQLAEHFALDSHQIEVQPKPPAGDA